MEDSGLNLRHCMDPGWDRTETNFQQLFDYLEAAAYTRNLDMGGVVALLDSLQPGQEITVTFDIRGREYNGRYFNNLQGWKITTAADQPGHSSPGQPNQSYTASGNDFGDDDIPF